MLSKSLLSLLIITFFTFIQDVSLQNSLSLSISTKSFTVIVGKNESFSFTQKNGTSNISFSVDLIENHEDLIQINPKQFNIPANVKNFEQTINVYGKNPGHIEIDTRITPSNIIDESGLFVKIIVANSSTIILVSFVIGWIYFAAWSISFYPQLWENWKRKSVVGLNFDFLSLNLIGHTLYAIFNTSMFWSPYVQEEYMRRFPKSVNPVELNDVFFSIHASIITFITILQCVFYERGDQRVSKTAKSIIGLYFVILIIFIILTTLDVVHILDLLNTCSYIKLSITLIKYIPQAVMNYQRKSTEGWSIGNIILDFTGGLFSMMQIMLNSYNYNDWASLLGDPTKLGLGLFSILFDILFIIQHYVLYRNLHPYESIPDSRSEEDDIENNSNDDV